MRAEDMRLDKSEGVRGGGGLRPGAEGSGPPCSRAPPPPPPAGVARAQPTVQIAGQSRAAPPPNREQSRWSLAVCTLIARMQSLEQLGSSRHSIDTVRGSRRGTSPAKPERTCHCRRQGQKGQQEDGGAPSTHGSRVNLVTGKAGSCTLADHTGPRPGWRAGVLAVASS